MNGNSLLWFAMQQQRDHLSIQDIQKLRNELMMSADEIGVGVIAAMFLLSFFWNLPKFAEAAHPRNRLRPVAHVGQLVRPRPSITDGPVLGREYHHLHSSQFGVFVEVSMPPDEAASDIEAADG